MTELVELAAKGELIESMAKEGTVGERGQDEIGNDVYGPISGCNINLMADGLVALANKHFGKTRVYVDNPSEVPEEYEVQEGEQADTYYYETDGQSSDIGEATQEAHSEFEPDPEEDVERFMESEQISEVLETTNDEPTMGFTLHRNLEQQEIGDEDEWLVGLGGVKFDRELNKDDLVDVYEEFLPLLQAYPGIRIGGYHFAEGGEFSIDITAAVKDEEEAAELGEKLNQESIFHAGDASLVETGGDGDSPLQDAGPEEIAEVINDVESLSEKSDKDINRIIQLMEKGLTESQEEMAREFAEQQPDHDNTDIYVSDDGDDAKSFYQIGMMSMKEPAIDVVDAENGFLIDGELYLPGPDADTPEESGNQSEGESGTGN
jgi:hypothetical protein